MDAYTVRYLHANFPDTAIGFGPFCDPYTDALNLSEMDNMQTGSLMEVCNHVSEITSNVFLYMSTEQIVDHVYAVTRVFSPDFFTTMDFHRPINHDNAYVRYLGEEPKVGNITDLPFP